MASGNIVHGMNGIYVGKFNNTYSLSSGGIYLVASFLEYTVVYYFAIAGYGSGNLYFNRLENNVWDFEVFKKIL